jgi:hypothetical protein
MADDVQEFAEAQIKRINAEKLRPDTQRLKEILDSRNNDDIIHHLEENRGIGNFEVSPLVQLTLPRPP